jgi:hypothetical protein
MFGPLEGFFLHVRLVNKLHVLVAKVLDSLCLTPIITYMHVFMLATI